MNWLLVAKLMGLFSLRATKVWAQEDPEDVGLEDNAEGGGEGGNAGAGGDRIDLVPTDNGFGRLKDLQVGDIVQGLITLSLIVASVVFFFMLVLGGVRWITSGGDEGKVKEARGQVTQALVGLAVVFSAWAILRLVQTLFLGQEMTDLVVPSFTTE